MPKCKPMFSRNHFFFLPITKGSVNALMKLAGFSTSNKVKNHCSEVNRNWVCKVIFYI